MTFGEDLGGGFGASATDSEAMLSHYLEQGGNLIDTANIYTSGHSEKIIGDFFRSGNAQRTLSEEEFADRFQLAWCCVHGYASLWVEGNRQSRSLNEAKRILRILRPSLVQE